MSTGFEGEKHYRKHYRQQRIPGSLKKKENLKIKAKKVKQKQKKAKAVEASSDEEIKW